MRLSQCRECARVRVVEVADGAAGAPSIAALGVRPGAVLRVTGRGDFGRVMVAVGGVRVVLDAATARRIGVRPVVARARQAS
ncbi:FeoA family protein [Georgenia sp. SYP-B2076]|uniref:FeoA family protein n=1 Tax=Georgenia sp. SYP-B2076 TaxID=2495881 RepID=UPI000F8C8126|nr:FeoA family protein [Georgenia sp. SYP-B2076]